MRTSLMIASALGVISLSASALIPVKLAFAGDQLTITSGVGPIE